MTPDDRTASPLGPEPTISASATDWMFGREFIRQVLYWSIGIAAVGGVIGWLISAEVAFAIGLWLGAAIDIATFRYLALQGFQRVEAGGSHGLSLTVLLVRYAGKGLLLVLAAVFAPPSAFWGVLAGVLVVEFMLVVVAIVRSSRDVFGSGSRQGPGVQS